MKGLFKRLMGVFVIVSLVCSTFAVPIEVERGFRYTTSRWNNGNSARRIRNRRSKI